MVFTVARSSNTQLHKIQPCAMMEDLLLLLLAPAACCWQRCMCSRGVITSWRGANWNCWGNWGLLVSCLYPSTYPARWPVYVSGGGSHDSTMRQHHWQASSWLAQGGASCERSWHHRITPGASRDCVDCSTLDTSRHWIGRCYAYKFSDQNMRHIQLTTHLL